MAATTSSSETGFSGASVHAKMPCVFTTGVIDVPSKKGGGRPLTVVALDALTPIAEELLPISTPTVKVDGTCCLWEDGVLYRRFDRKLSLTGQKKLEKWRKENSDVLDAATLNPPEWDEGSDFKDGPTGWFASAPPSAHGHWVGWVAVTPGRPHGDGNDLWHTRALDGDRGVVFVIQPDADGRVVTCEIPMGEMKNRTYELVGPKVQGNTYNLPSVVATGAPKNTERHWLVPHGSILFHEPPPLPLTLDGLRNWFKTSPSGAVEGVVWHAPNGLMMKVHRGHVNLPWPLKNLHLLTPPPSEVVEEGQGQEKEKEGEERKEEGLVDETSST